MANFFRKLRQRFTDKELGVLGAEIERLNEDLLQLGIKNDALTERFERLQSRYGMRMVRASRGEQPQPMQRGRQPFDPSRQMTDEEILSEIDAIARGGH